MKLSDYKGEDALEVLAELIEPAAEVFGDPEFRKIYNSGPKVKAVKYALKQHKEPILYMLATLDGESPETYRPGLLTLPAKLLEILNDPELVSLFQSQAQSTDKTSSGPATENTEAHDE